MAITWSRRARAPPGIRARRCWNFSKKFPPTAAGEELPARFPVQYVLRPNLDFRGYAGQLASGVFRKGDLVLALPARRHSRIARIVTYDGDLASAYAPQSVTICLEDEIDISRGDMIVPAFAAPHVARRFRSSMRLDEREAARTRPQLLHQAHLASGARRDPQHSPSARREHARRMWRRSGSS